MEASDRSRRTLIIGLGNPLMGRDGFGARVIELLLCEQPGLLPNADLADAQTDVLHQIDRFPAYARVVLVDAILDPQAKVGSAGSIVVLDEDALNQMPEFSPGAHQLSPLLAVKLFRSLHPNAATEILLLGLCADRIEMRRALSGESGDLDEETVAAGVRRVKELL